jgi:Ca-activated chloride channel family protein
MKAVLVLLVATLSASSSLAPSSATVTIRGRVTDSTTHKPLASANVVIVETSSSVGTAADGTYELRFRPPQGMSRVSLRVRRIGYAPQTRLIDVSAATAITADFSLRQDVSQLDELVVTGIASKVSGVKRLGAAPALVAQSRDMSGYGIRQRREPWNTEGYSAIDENPYFLARERALSTFSVDVDRASYSNVRRFLNEGSKPPKDAVRIEELVNYFPYSYAEPRGNDPVSITTSIASAPWNRSHRLVMIGLKARSIPTASLPPNNLVFLIDVSGSMDEPNKLPLVKSAFELLVNQLRPQDRVAIVVYAGNAGLVLPSTRGSNKETILEAITRLEAGGSTAGGAGLRLAYNVAKENFIRGGNNRVILATDGDFNVGESSDAEMVRLIEDRRKTGVFLTTLGFGTGNIKDSKLEQLADKGNGNYAYVDNILEAKKVFVRELGATLRTVAKDVKLQIEFNPRKVAAYRLIGYENRLLNDQDFSDDSKDAGDMGAGHTVTALYEIVPVGAPPDSLIPRGTDLRYQEPRQVASAGSGDEMLFVKLRYKDSDGSTSKLMTHPVKDAVSSQNSDFAFASAVAEFGLLLRDSRYRGNSSFASVTELARATLGDDPDGLRREFVTLVEKASTLQRVVGMGR